MLIFVLLHVIFIAVSPGYALTSFQRRPSLSGLKPDNSSNAIRTTTRSKLECALRCKQLSGCNSIFYIHLTGLCEQHDYRYKSDSPGLIAAPSAVYYEKGDTPDCSTQFVCPNEEFAKDFKTAVLGDCTTVKYRIFDDMERSYRAASTLCKKEGGKLLKITTLAKMTYFRSIMSSNCTRFASRSIWVNGKYNNITGVWETEDGERLPMEHDTFWWPGEPNHANPARDNCMGMSCCGFKHLWDDTDCMDRDKKAICEKP